MGCKFLHVVELELLVSFPTGTDMHADAYAMRNGLIHATIVNNESILKTHNGCDEIELNSLISGFTVLNYVKHTKTVSTCQTRRN